MLREQTKGWEALRRSEAVPVISWEAAPAWEGLVPTEDDKGSIATEQVGHPPRRAGDTAERQEALGSNPNSATSYSGSLESAYV